MTKSDSMPCQSLIHINALRHIFIIKVSKRPSRTKTVILLPCSAAPTQSGSGAMEKSKPSRRGRHGTEIKSVGQCCHPVLPALAPTSFHLCGCADPLRMAFHYSSTDNNRSIHFGAISGRWPQSYSSVPSSFSH